MQTRLTTQPLKMLNLREVKAPWADASVSYSTAKTSEIEKPACVDVAA